MRASLPWYDLPEARAANDRFWARVRGHLVEVGIEAPAHLDRETPFETQWTDPDLLLSQACGLDLLGPLGTSLRVVGVPTFNAPGCSPGAYRSFVVVRAGEGASLEDLRGRRCAINSPTSHSGMNALRQMVAPLAREGRFFSAVVVSGAHQSSLELLAAGACDVACVDCITWAMVGDHRPSDLEGLAVLCETAPAPAPPLVTAAHRGDDEVALLFAAIEAALGAPVDEALPAVRLVALERGDLSAYAPIAEAMRASLAHGYRDMDEVSGMLRAPD